MTAPMLAKATDYGRMYARTRGGDVKVPSITTVLDVFNPEMGWWDALCAAKETAENAVAIVEALAALTTDKAKRALIRDFVDIHKDAAERDRNVAAERGDFVHNYAEAYALHLMGRIPYSEVKHHLELCREHDLMAYIDSFHAFWNKFDPKPKLPEATVWNRTIGYAGTTDLGCEINGIDVIIDWKTKKKVLEYRPAWDPEPARPKKNALNTKVGMQLAAAARAEELWVPGATPEEDRWEEWTFRPELGVAIAIGPDTYVARPFDIWHPRVWDTYTSLAKAWNWRWYEARVMGPDLIGPDQITSALTPSRLPISPVSVAA